MKKIEKRALLCLLLAAALLLGSGLFVFRFVKNGGRWVSFAANRHLYNRQGQLSVGRVLDRDGDVLSWTEEDGTRRWYDNSTVRKATLHAVGDAQGNIGTGALVAFADQLSGYNLLTGAYSPLGAGNDLYLTLDARYNYIAYEALAGRKGAVGVYNYETGEILAKVSAPTFDPNAVPEDLETNEAYKGVYLDNTLSGSFTPGSIFKIVTVAAAMERYPDSWSSITYNCQGAVELAGSDITCLNGHAHGSQDMSAALGNSCNVYFAQLANDLGAEALQQKAEEMGFNTQIDFGSIPIAQSTIDLADTNANQLGWAGVGQYTVLTNPYHMMVLMGAIANGGAYVEPKLTQDSGLLEGLSSGDRTLVTSTEAQNLKTLLRTNVESYYGDWLFPAGMNVCAKTGTGEVGEGKGPNCWMVGFCDSTVTPYAFAVVVEDGAGGIETAGSVASAVLTALAS